MKGSMLGRTAFSAVVALALGFGVREAVASPAAAQARPYCEDDLACEATCQQMYGPNAVGMCSSGNTCYCYY
ncbi:MAG TPA: hypothetical protein VE871_15970 [Longimicrobium sp.]|nr:hypothetical protein [Longimicrobium sp.]